MRSLHNKPKNIALSLGTQILKAKKRAKTPQSTIRNAMLMLFGA
jgi:hypothetical protein